MSYCDFDRIVCMRSEGQYVNSSTLVYVCLILDSNVVNPLQVLKIEQGGEREIPTHY